MSERTRPLDFYLTLGIRTGYSQGAFHHTNNAALIAREAAFDAGRPAPDDRQRALAIDSALRADALLERICARAAGEWERRT